MAVRLCLWSSPTCHVRGLSRGQCPQQRTPGLRGDQTPQVKLDGTLERQDRMKGALFQREAGPVAMLSLGQ